MKKTPIVQLDTTGLALAKYNSLVVAANTNRVDTSSVRQMMAGKRNHVGGYKWDKVKNQKNPFRASLGNDTIIQVEKTTGETVAMYRNLAALLEVTGYTAQSINRVLEHGGKSAHGFLWQRP